AHRGMFLEGSLKSTRLLRKLPGRRGNPVFARVQDLRTRLLAQLDLLVPPSLRRDHNAVLRAMLLGDRGFLSPRLKQQFRRSGAYHVLVVSGLHVGMIALFVFWLVRRLIRNEWATAMVTIAALVFYLLLVEDRPPIERAVWMVSLYLMARLLFRQVHLANSVALAALVVLFLHPLWLFEPSFHLSFGAAFLIAFFALPWRERTSAPYRDALGFLDAAERDDQLRPPRLAQFRLDLRLLSAALAERLFWTQSKERAAHRLLTGTVRLGLTVWDFFLISFAIHLGFVLMTAFYFKRVVWAGLLTNLLVVPLVGWIVPLGLTGLLLSLLWLPAGALLAELASTLTGGLLWLVDAIHGRGLSYGIPPPPVWLVLLYAAALALLGVAVARQRLQRWAGVGLAVLLLVVVTFPFPPRIPGRVLEVTVLDVGQGDSLFLTFPNGEAWLLDAGRGPVDIQPGYATGEAIGETVVVPYLRARGVKRLDRVWLSHAHLDHMGGLPAVLEEFSVGDFNVGRTPPSLRYQELLRKISEHNIPLKTHAAGERFAVGEVHVEVLWPGADYQPGAEPSNNDSLVLRLCLPAQAGRTDTCILLPGDIEAEVEQKLAQGEATLAAAVLKVPHHGGHHAASSEFLAAVSPRVAVISVGAYNRFAHPYPAVIERLATRARRIYRTDRDGSVTVRLDGGELRVETHRQQQRRETYPNFWAKLAACARRLAPVELF
ncbi:MAG: ComEC/Rec2 family competence protein, partial [Terriglobia bacterium]